jgi:hypothetical protein
VAKAFAYLIVGLRFPVVLGWAAAVVLAVLFLPPLPSSGGLSDLIPAGSAAAQADASAARLFGYPLEAGIAIVQSHPHALSQAVVDKTARAADRYDHHASIPGLVAVIPIPNGAGIPQAITVSPASAAGLLAGCVSAPRRSSPSSSSALTPRCSSRFPTPASTRTATWRTSSASPGRWPRSMSRA